MGLLRQRRQLHRPRGQALHLQLHVLPKQRSPPRWQLNRAVLQHQPQTLVARLYQRRDHLPIEQPQGTRHVGLHHGQPHLGRQR